jgi:hypothetical protein
MSYLRYCVFGCVEWCPTHIVLCFCFVFRLLVCHMLSVVSIVSFSTGPHYAKTKIKNIFLKKLHFKYLHFLLRNIHPLLVRILQWTCTPRGINGCCTVSTSA